MLGALLLAILADGGGWSCHNDTVEDQRRGGEICRINHLQALWADTNNDKCFCGDTEVSERFNKIPGRVQASRTVKFSLTTGIRM